MERFLREVDPGLRLPPAEREERARALRRAHMLRLARASAAARKNDTKRHSASNGPVRRPDTPRIAHPTKKPLASPNASALSKEAKATVDETVALEEVRDEPARPAS
jgi:hypothetical protein